MVLLVLLVMPVIALYVAKEVRKLRTEEFVDAARILGGSRRHIVIKHIFPHLYMTFILVFLQQFTQTLTILLHLGLLEVFFGGTVTFGGPIKEVESYTHEWSGLIGVYFRALTVNPWIPLVPITFLGLLFFRKYDCKKYRRGDDESKVRRRAKEGCCRRGTACCAVKRRVIYF